MRIVLLASQVKSNVEKGKVLESVLKLCSNKRIFSADFTKFMVIGGDEHGLGGRLDKVEVIDLSSNTASCSPIANYPWPVDVAAGAIVEGRPRVCGGNGGAGDRCYEYNYEENRWEEVDSLATPVSWQGGSLVNDATWLLTGGWDGNAYVSSTQVRGLGDDRFRSGPSMPRVIGQHCQVTIDPNIIFVLGGYNGTDYDKSVYRWDLAHGNWYNYY